MTDEILIDIMIVWGSIVLGLAILYKGKWSSRKWFILAGVLVLAIGLASAFNQQLNLKTLLIVTVSIVVFIAVMLIFLPRLAKKHPDIIKFRDSLF